LLLNSVYELHTGTDQWQKDSAIQPPPALLGDVEQLENRGGGLNSPPLSKSTKTRFIRYDTLRGILATRSNEDMKAWVDGNSTQMAFSVTEANERLRKRLRCGNNRQN